MGADIHIYAERKLKDGTWAMCSGYNGIDNAVFQGDSGPKCNYFRVKSRDYNFFAALAGVRGFGPDPKGLPDDVSPLVREEAESWSSDGHSHSWYSAEEFVPIFMDYKLTDKERTDLVAHKLEVSYSTDIAVTVLEKFLGLDLPYKDGEEDPSVIRFVFWFDN